MHAKPRRKLTIFIEYEYQAITRIKICLLAHVSMKKADITEGVKATLEAIG